MNPPSPSTAAPDAIPRDAGAPAAPAFPSDWRWQHAHAATSLEDVERLFPGRFDLAGVDRARTAEAIACYGMRVTPYYLSLARAARRDDPVWTLAVPSPDELDVRPEERDDPIGDETDANRPVAGVTRRYRDRALLQPTPICSVHCRHCFRKRLVGNAAWALDDARLDAAFAFLAREREVHEVILTGGDPLTLSDDRLLAILGRLDALEHVWSLRIHTRMPVVNPFRVDDALAARLAALATPVIVVTHFNHAVEVTPEAALAVRALRTRGIDVLNQAVLLAGVNDTPDVQRELLWALVRAGARPYALHQADLVPGTAHLRTPLEVGRALMRALRGTVPGWMIPRWMLDVPGGHGKVPLDHAWTRLDADGTLHVEAPDGTRHAY